VVNLTNEIVAHLKNIVIISKFICNDMVEMNKMINKLDMIIADINSPHFLRIHVKTDDY